MFGALTREYGGTAWPGLDSAQVAPIASPSRVRVVSGHAIGGRTNRHGDG